MDGGTEVYGTLVSDIQTDVSVTGKPVYLTASGNEIMVDVKKGYMKNPVITMLPIQDLNGYDKPWSGGAGKNLVDYQNITIVTAGFIFNTSFNGESGYYTLSFDLVNDTMGNLTFRTYLNGEVVDGTTVQISEGNRRVSVTLNTDTFDSWRCYWDKYGKISNIQIELGSSATSYEPYENICPISPRTKTEISVNGSVTTIDYGEEIYGGTCEVATGETKSEWETLVLNGTQPISITNWRPTADGVGWIYPYRITNNEPCPSSEVPNIIADKLQTVNYSSLYNGGVGISLYSSTDVGVCIRTHNISLTSVELINAYLSQNPITICYKKTTPQIELITKGYVPLDKGTNEITLSNNDIITFDYYSTLAGKLSGTLYYIENGLAPSGYLSGSGNFIALHLDSDDWSIYTSVKVGLDPSQASGMVEILQDEEKIVVGKITDNEQVFIVESTDGELTKTDVYSLSDLVLETE